MKILNKIKNWFFDNYVYRYLVEFPFKTHFQETQEKRRKNFNPQSIIDVLNSNEYKDYFFRVTTGHFNNSYSHTNKHFREKYSILKNNLGGIVKRLLAKFFLYLFHRYTYNEIKRYIKRSKQYSNLFDKVDNYLNYTSYKERINNAVNLNVLNENFVQAQMRMINNKQKRISEIEEQNAR